MTKEQFAIQLIERFEGCKLTAYLCPAKVWTIGIGTTKINGIPVIQGQTCTREEAEKYLNDHLSKHVYPQVDKLCNDISVPDKIYATLCSFGYNEGCGYFTEPEFINTVSNQEWGTFHNDTFTGTGLAGVLIKYIKIKENGVLVKSQGLINRRRAEVKFMLEI